MSDFKNGQIIKFSNHYGIGNGNAINIFGQITAIKNNKLYIKILDTVTPTEVIIDLE